MERLYGDEKELLDLIVRKNKSVNELNSFYLEKYLPNPSNIIEVGFHKRGLISHRLSNLVSSLIQKGYIDSSSHIANADQGCTIISIYATSDGNAYFDWEDEQKVFTTITGEARRLLQAMIENKDRLADFINEDLDAHENRDETLRYMKSKGFFKEAIFDITGLWHVELSYEGLHYFELEKEYLERQKQAPSQIYNVNNRGVIQVGNGNTATQNNGIDFMQLEKLLAKLREAAPATMSDDEKEILNDGIETIHHELQQPNPRRSLVKMAITGLQGIKGSLEFVAAATAIYQFIQPIIS